MSAQDTYPSAAGLREIDHRLRGIAQFIQSELKNIYALMREYGVDSSYVFDPYRLAETGFGRESFNIIQLLALVNRAKVHQTVDGKFLLELNQAELPSFLDYSTFSPERSNSDGPHMADEKDSDYDLEKELTELAKTFQRIKSKSEDLERINQSNREKTDEITRLLKEKRPALG